MKKTYCDVCGKELPEDEQTVEICYLESVSNSLEPIIDDVCFDCKDKIIETINKMKKKQ